MRAAAGRINPANPSKPPQSKVKQIVQMVIGLALAAALLIWGLPYFAQTTWADMWQIIRTIPLGPGAALFLLVLLGLYFYTFTFTGALPGLTHGKALIVNLCGSSVANLLPGGGAAGLAATVTILRSWGFTRRDVSTMAIVTGVWNLLARLVLPVFAIGLLIRGSDDVPTVLKDAALAGLVGGGAIIVIFIAILASERAAQVVGAAVDRFLTFILRRRRKRWSVSVEALVSDIRARTSDVVRGGWLPMTLGMVGFFGVYFVLFVLCLWLVGVTNLFYGQMFAAYAIGRLLTAVGVTPSGLGVTETATAAALVAWGANPAAAAAGVVIFALYTHLSEVPLGALGWVLWSASEKSETPPPQSMSARGGPVKYQPLAIIAEGAGEAPGETAPDTADPSPDVH